MTTGNLLELAEIVLKNNKFQFNERTLKQLRGTTINITFAPTCNFIYGWPFEVRILEDIERQPRVWWRYINGIFFIWEYVEDSFKQFIEILNACYYTIKLTAEWSKEEIILLNIKVRLRNRQLETDLHIKPTDTHQFLDWTSCHLFHCKKSMPYSQALRYSRICFN